MTPKERAELHDPAGRIIECSIEDEVRGAFLDYSMSVIAGRALPDARDGLKPVQRRILYAMELLKLHPGRAYKKCAAVVGEVLGKFHPHGDSAVYDALVRLAQDFSLGLPLVDGQGNFGSIDGDPAAAYRYTESRLTPASVALLDGLDEETVDFAPTFDAAHTEPQVLPSAFPNLLANGATGIAVGMATNIPPHNLRELAAAVAVLCDDPQSPDEDVLASIKGPDFPTGGIIVDGQSQISSYLLTGGGKIILRGRAHVEREHGGRTYLIVTEVPYATVKSRILEKIADLVREKRLPEIADLRDESDRDGIRVVIGLKRDADPKKTLEKLYKMTPLQGTVGVNLLALVGKRPVTLTVRGALETFLEHRLVVGRRRAEFRLGKARARLHVLDGLLIAIANIDEIVAIIKASKNRAAAAVKLEKRFDISEIQSGAILALRLSGLTALDVADLRSEKKQTESTVEDLLHYLNTPERQRKEIKDSVLEFASEYGCDRRTSIMSPGDAKDLTRRVADEHVRTVLTSRNRLVVHPVGSQKQSTNLDVENAPVLVAQIPVTERLGVVLDDGQVHPLDLRPVLELGARGLSLHKSLDVSADRRAVLFLKPEDLGEDRQIVFVTASGKVKKAKASELANMRKGGVLAMKLADGDRVVSAFSVQDKDEIVLASRAGQGIRFSAADVPAQGRSAGGVVGMKLKDHDTLVGGGVAGREALLVAAAGSWKRISVEEIPSQKRGGQGVRLWGNVERVGPTLLMALSPLSSVVVVYDHSGDPHPIGVSESPPCARNHQGESLSIAPITGAFMVDPDAARLLDP